MWHFRKAPLVTYAAFMGCLIQIIAIALDPFTQQILRYSTVLVPELGAAATIPYAHSYDNEETGFGEGATTQIG